MAYQPLSDAEALQGALNRAQRVREVALNTDLWVGIEGGVEDVNEELRAFV